MLFACLNTKAQNVVVNLDMLHDCDLLFHVPENENNITDVTSVKDKISADHVAVFLRIEDVAMVIDATHRGVALRRADSIMVEKGHYVSVRVSNVDVRNTIRNLLMFVGRPYDYKFFADDSEIYCSELVQKCFVDMSGNKIFTTIPMSFHDDSGEVTQYWKDYYRIRWNTTVPEGEEGTNPSDIYVQALRHKILD